MFSYNKDISHDCDIKFNYYNKFNVLCYFIVYATADIIHDRRGHK